MHRMWAIVERELRRFKRSPMLIFFSLVFPLVQLVILGYAFGGNVKHLTVAIVDHDHGVPAVKVRELAAAVAANAKTFDTVTYSDEGEALTALRTGLVNGVLTIPADFSRRTLADQSPRIALIADNTDNFVASALTGTISGLVSAYNEPAVPASRTGSAVALDVVEVYPYVPYIQYLLPGSITMSIFMMVMIGGGIIFIDDKARGLHEGYLVTPITRLELITGFNVSGTIKAVLAGIVLMTIGSRDCRRPGCIRTDSAAAPLRRDRRDVARAHQHDVPDHGAGAGSTLAARDFRRVEHAALFPERRGVSAAGVPAVDALDCRRRSVHLFGACVQEPAPEEHRDGCDHLRPGVPDRLLDRRDDRGDAALQALALMPPRDPVTRIRIIEHAASLFAERGFEKVTVREICDAASVNVAAVNYHFGDKDALYRAVVRRAVAAMRETNELSVEAGRGARPEAQLRAYIHVFLSRMSGRDRYSWIHKLMTREMEGPSEVTRLVLREVLEPRMQHLSAIVGEIAGLQPDDPRVMRAVLSIQGQILLFGRPIAPRTPQLWARLLADSTVAADHIANFSIAAIRDLAALPA